MRASPDSGNLYFCRRLGPIEANLSQVVGRILAAILTLTACYIHALTIKHAVTPKFWHGFHPKQT